MRTNNIWTVTDAEGVIVAMASTERAARARAHALGLGDAHVHRIAPPQRLGAWPIDHPDRLPAAGGNGNEEEEAPS